jgi:hypothetical protein
MAIGSAVQKGKVIHIYNEQGSYISAVEARDGLQGYTSSSVSVRHGNIIRIYNENGGNIGAVSAR